MRGALFANSPSGAEDPRGVVHQILRELEDLNQRIDDLKIQHDLILRAVTSSPINFPDLVVSVDACAGEVVLANQGRGCWPLFDIQLFITINEVRENVFLQTLCPGEQVTHPFDCSFGPDCNVFAEVEMAAGILEEDKTNNSASDFCAG